MTVAGLLAGYRACRFTPADVVDRTFTRIADEGLAPIWISLADREAALQRARHVDLSLPLAGVPFAVKDNIDVAGLPTTAGCPSFAYVPARTATVVERLFDAGAILIGKTNLDQFATGLVGTRSGYGACGNVVDSRFISGGSSSGSALAVAKGLCAFSLGTDTAGSGRVPAALNGLVGLKPTRGVLSTGGVVPACRSIDCVSVFATGGADARNVWMIAKGFDASDPYSRHEPTPAALRPWATGAVRFGVPESSSLEFFGDDQAAALFQQAVRTLERCGGTPVVVDWTPFRRAGELLYGGPWVAERLSVLREFLSTSPRDVDPSVASIIGDASRLTAVDAFLALDRLQRLKRETEAVWERIDMLLLPTAPTIYTRAAVEADPIRLNANLGIYTTFVNLLDLAAVAIPAGTRTNGLPFGVSLIGRAFSDASLLTLAQRLLGEPVEESPVPQQDIAVAVVGAHLTGQPLNPELVVRGGLLLRAARTAPRYRLYAMGRTAPPKPGLVRVDNGSGAAIEIEVWMLSAAQFGEFVAAIPPPLAMGKVELDTGEWVSGFVCEPAAMAGARDITAFGGWRAYLASTSRP